MRVFLVSILVVSSCSLAITSPTLGAKKNIDSSVVISTVNEAASGLTNILDKASNLRDNIRNGSSKLVSANADVDLSLQANTSGTADLITSANVSLQKPSNKVADALLGTNKDTADSKQLGASTNINLNSNYASDAKANLQNFAYEVTNGKKASRGEVSLDLNIAGGDLSANSNSFASSSIEGATDSQNVGDGTSVNLSSSAASVAETVSQNSADAISVSNSDSELKVSSGNFSSNSNSVSNVNLNSNIAIDANYDSKKTADKVFAALLSKRKILINIRAALRTKLNHMLNLLGKAEHGADVGSQQIEDGSDGNITSSAASSGKVNISTGINGKATESLHQIDELLSLLQKSVRPEKMRLIVALKKSLISAADLKDNLITEASKSIIANSDIGFIPKQAETAQGGLIGSNNDNLKKNLDQVVGLLSNLKNVLRSALN